MPGFARTALCLVLLAPVAASANPDTGSANPGVHASASTITDAELQAMAHLHHVNQMEISLGKLAQANGTTAAKAYGKMLVRDHARSDRDLMALARRAKVTLPADEPRDEEEARLDKDATATAERLKTLRGKQFDRELTEMMRDGHQRELVRIDQAIAIGTHARVIALLKKLRPLLKKHAARAEIVFVAATETKP